MASKITTEILSINSSKGNDPENIDLNDTVVIKNVIDGREKIDREVKVEWLFGTVSNYFLAHSTPDEKRVGMLIRQAAKQNMPFTVSRDVWAYIRKHPQK